VRRFRISKENARSKSLFSAASAPLLFLCADEIQPLSIKDVGNRQSLKDTEGDGDGDPHDDNEGEDEHLARPEPIVFGIKTLDAQAEPS
jgi:hypothetical protein